MNEITEWPIPIKDPFHTNAEKDRDKQKRILELIGTIFFYGEMQIETPAENELVYLLKDIGYWFETEDELIKKLYNK